LQKQKMPGVYVIPSEQSSLGKINWKMFLVIHKG
jgi:hypothetical protein